MLLPLGGRLILVIHCLTNIPMYIMGFYLLQDEVHNKMDRVHSRFFWEKEHGKKKNTIR